ncbi:IS4 family transposase [Streptomyces sp. NBC_00513]|uniref:IS4 family transposase n=1 Tax=unclassified Streptomyces TaxID=2593676 RepID=UPI0022553A61|nr:IS4 family transposase [Streptomyces sp. NBC_00424]MCX5078610.1 IS4 family transposase [Streptomyces sp. NBC_00424]WUD45707.1 IS4 family transposase [Streptomyces sp. NBC_00513]WUD46180.1 IS4 family transposase [Streptomyces sp. NBC_00513]
MASGRFAPGHLGGLTQIVPFDLVDALLDETRCVQRRLRVLPSRVGVYFLLAMCMFPEVGYRLVWSKLIAALTSGGLEVADPTAKALRDLRRRIGTEPMRRLFDVLAGPLARPTTPGVRFGPFRMVSFDGCSSIKIPDTDRNVEWFGPGNRGGHPMLELMTLAETGTRALIGAVFGPTSDGETAYARRLLHHLGPDMLVMWDKGFDANAFLASVNDTGAKFLGRLRANRRTPVLAPLADGSYLSVIGAVPVRVIEAQITVTCGDSSFTGSYRLVTTLTDARRYPATILVTLYHQRWEHESAYYALRHTITDGRVLRSGDPVGVEQEMWALLTLYQALRTVMVEAAESRPGTDPDRCGFTIAIQTARDLVVQAAEIVSPIAGTAGVIANRVLAGLLPHRRPSISTRKVRSSISRYAERQDDGRPDTSLPVTGLDVTILEPEPDLPTVSHDDRHIPPTDRRRQRVLDLLDADPDRHWHTRELARHLGDITLSTMYRQLDRWAAHGLIDKTGPAIYSSPRSHPTPLPPAEMR